MQDWVPHLLAAKGTLVAAWLATLFLLERLRPAAPWPVRPDKAGQDEEKGVLRRFGLGARTGRNFSLFALNIALSPLVIVPASAWAAGHALAWRPGWWDGAFGLALDLLLLDCLIYWWHRANHEAPFLWRFHEVHHLDRFLDTSSAVRFHFGEVLLSAAARAGVVVLLDFPIASVLAFETALQIAAIFHHSNVRLPPAIERMLSRVVVTPSIHWVHHHRVRRDTDSNYATILSLWDPLFRSRSSTHRRPEMPIGVEGREERPLPALVATPFRRT